MNPESATGFPSPDTAATCRPVPPPVLSTAASGVPAPNSSITATVSEIREAVEGSDTGPVGADGPRLGPVSRETRVRGEGGGPPSTPPSICAPGAPVGTPRTAAPSTGSPAVPASPRCCVPPGSAPGVPRIRVPAPVVSRETTGGVSSSSAPRIPTSPPETTRGDEFEPTTDDPLTIHRSMTPSPPPRVVVPDHRDQESSGRAPSSRSLSPDSREVASPGIPGAPRSGPVPGTPLGSVVVPLSGGVSGSTPSGMVVPAPPLPVTGCPDHTLTASDGGSPSSVSSTTTGHRGSTAMAPSPRGVSACPTRSPITARTVGPSTACSALSGPPSSVAGSGSTVVGSSSSVAGSSSSVTVLPGGECLPRVGGPVSATAREPVPRETSPTATGRNSPTTTPRCVVLSTSASTGRTGSSLGHPRPRAVAPSDPSGHPSPDTFRSFCLSPKPMDIARPFRHQPQRPSLPDTSGQRPAATTTEPRIGPT